MDDRGRDLEAIRATYARYRRESRDRLWDMSNAGYARISSDRDAALVQLVSRSLPHGQIGDVLDCGCGAGELADVVREDVRDVSWTGVDLLPDAISVARARRPWANWLEASVDALPFPDQTFDVVVASTLLSSLPSRSMERNAAREMSRVLRPGGSVIVYDVRYRNPANPAIHAITPRRLSGLFPGWVVDVRYMTLAPPIARRLGRATPYLYHLLERIGPLRSHLLARIQREAHHERQSETALGTRGRARSTSGIIQ